MVAAGLATTLLAGHASGCGLEGDSMTLEKVAVGYAYPDSLNVMAAVSSARLSGKLDRTINTFVILGLWLEDKSLGKDEAFAEAFARGLARLVTFLGAGKLDAKAIREPLLRRRAAALKPG